MSTQKEVILSVVVPVYNEGAGLPAFHRALLAVVEKLGVEFEIIYCDDGSSDKTSEFVREWHAVDPRIKLIQLSRNFGKEYALSAGIAEAQGQAIIMLDGDGQHPVELISKFVSAWKNGAQVVIGQCINRRSDSWLKRLGSRLFYKILNSLTDQKLISGMTDFRLIDHTVQQAFVTLPETDRMTKALIDWLGFRRVFIEYEENGRETGQPGYNFGDLSKLAVNSFVSLTPTPLYLFGALGVLITAGAFVLGTAVLIEQVVLNDPWHWKFTGTAMLGILILFLVGIVLMSQGILSLYISHVHNQSKRRPLYVIDREASAGIDDES